MTYNSVWTSMFIYIYIYIYIYTHTKYVCIYLHIFQKLLIYWDFHTQTISRVYREWSEKRKYPVNDSCVDENALLMSEVRGEWADWLEMIEKQQ